MEEGLRGSASSVYFGTPPTELSSPNVGNGGHPILFTSFFGGASQKPFYFKMLITRDHTKVYTQPGMLQYRAQFLF